MAENTRAPIVTVLGHVDSGKTSLLDVIRKTQIAKREAGGITQSIGASQITTKEGKKITFIDTPGHLAFEKMRSRGAMVADLVVLVVAADDGVAPQTKESLEYIRQSKTPFIVAITKVDIPSANKDSVVGQLEKEGVHFEGRGGDTPVIGVSAKTRQGLDDLLELISLVAEIRDVSGDPQGKLEAVIIETGKDRKGNLATAIIRSGTLRIGDQISAEETGCKVKALIGSGAENLSQALPGDPVQILGFEELPPVGAILKPGVALKKESFQKREFASREGVFNIVVKADTNGKIEAVEKVIPEGVNIVFSGVGAVNQGDVFLAKSTGSKIVVFGLKVDKSIASLAVSEGVEIVTSKVIYEIAKILTDFVKTEQEETLGKAQILAVFTTKQGAIGGCKVLSGRVTKGDKIEILREGKKIADVKVASMRQFEKEISSAQEEEEFGISFTSSIDFRVDDMLVSVRS